MNIIRKHWAKLFLPPTKRCMLCERVIQQYPSTHQKKAGEQLEHYIKELLCHTCLSTIPWITTIQCERCGRGLVCGDCSYKSSSSLRRNRSAVHYNDQMKEWLRLYKFQGNQSLYKLLGSMLLPVFLSITLRLVYDLKLENHWKSSKQSLGSYAERYKLWDYIVPVPSSEERMRERGFNQAEQLARYMSSSLEIEYANLLIRQYDSEKLSFQGKWQRAQSVTNKYTVNNELWHKLRVEREAALKHNHPVSKENNKKDVIHILIIDDVYTTGYTLDQCAKALVEATTAQIHIYSITWARA